MIGTEYGKLLHHRDTEDTEKAHPSEPTEAGAVSKSIEAFD